VRIRHGSLGPQPATFTTGAETKVHVQTTQWGLNNRQEVRFSTTGTLPTGITAGVSYWASLNYDTPYSNTTWDLYTTSTGSTRVATSSAGTGVHRMYRPDHTTPYAISHCTGEQYTVTLTPVSPAATGDTCIITVTNPQTPPVLGHTAFGGRF
jgi:hypothetical protein